MQHTGVSKANSAPSHIWLKTKLRIDSEIQRIDSESLESESYNGVLVPHKKKKKSKITRLKS